jgi:hypothetical protein
MKLQANKFTIDEIKSLDDTDMEFYRWESPAGLLMLEDLEGHDIASFKATTPENLDGDILDEKFAMRRELAKLAKQHQQDQIADVLKGFGLHSTTPLAKQVRTLAYAKAVANALGKHVSSELGSIEVVARKTVARKGKTVRMARVDMRYGGTFWVADSKR